MMLRVRILWLISIAYFIAGFQVYETKATTAQLKAADPTVEAHLRLLTLHQIGWLFMLSSIVAVLLTLLRKVEYAYSLMVFVLAFWTFLYFASWAENGHWEAIYGIANYGLTMGLLLLCSRIVEIPGKKSIPVALPPTPAAVVLQEVIIKELEKKHELEDRLDERRAQKREEDEQQ